jgi:hypothetical protein
MLNDSVPPDLDAIDTDILHLIVSWISTSTTIMRLRRRVTFWRAFMGGRPSRRFDPNESNMRSTG